MNQRRHPCTHISLAAVCLLGAFASCGLNSCGSTEASIAAMTGGTVVTTAVGAYTPAHEIEQTYYLGVFDPQEQVPPAMYRVRVHGQASAISSMRFGSGWVPASLVDSLNSSLQYDVKSGELKIQTGDDEHSAQLKPGRRLVLFGPEGFREAPKNYRLVIVMGSSPEDWFAAVDETLGFFGSTLNAQRTQDLERELFKALARVKGEQQRLADLKVDRQQSAEGGGK